MVTKWTGNTYPNKVSIGDGLWGNPQKSKRTREAPWYPIGSSSETLEVSHSQAQREHPYLGSQSLPFPDFNTTLEPLKPSFHVLRMHHAVL